MDGQAYLSLLQAVLPPGAAWPREPNAQLTKLLQALADEMARVHARCDDLLSEADPARTYEMLTDWERAYGLPPACLVGISQTIQQRRDALVAQISGIGGQSAQYFIDLAASAGYAITISNYSPWTFNDPFSEPMYGLEWRFAWLVTAPTATVRYWTFTDPFDEPFSYWGNELLECLMNTYGPAEGIALFQYT